MLTVREQLAKRLSEWGCAQCDMPLSWWMDLADECIRQMEWARQHCVAAWQPDYDDCELDFSDPLTVAPDDWKP